MIDVRLLSIVALLVALTWRASAESTQAPEGTPEPLSRTRVPEPSNLAEFVRDRRAAIQLGKALFWDMQTGSDGIQACATCHFHAGADGRARNRINPDPKGGRTFHDAGGRFGPSSTLAARDFPLVGTHEVVGSQGIVARAFEAIVEGAAREKSSPPLATPFEKDGAALRQVTPRHAPSVIGAVFNATQFWDGRARSVFNGVNERGAGDRDARIFRVEAESVVPVIARIDSAALASQATAPATNQVEMTYDGRTFPLLGRKLLSLEPLAKQRVSARDSVLGSLVAATGELETSYERLVRAAFQPALWDFPGRPVAIGGQSFRLIEANFSLFWGLAIQLYESTLVPDATPFDRFCEDVARGKKDSTAMDGVGNGNARAGLAVFLGDVDFSDEKTGGDFVIHRTTCAQCHIGPELTACSVASIGRSGTTRSTRNQYMDVVRLEVGFRNTGVRATADDPGLTVAGSEGQSPSEIRGQFKIPQLRNVELTGPYFHSGSAITLRQVVDFYDRGGDFAAGNGAAVDDNLPRLDLAIFEKDWLVDFLLALTDRRVRDESAPFDHPSIDVPDGAVGEVEGVALDVFRHVPAVGAEGHPREPLRPVLIPEGAKATNAQVNAFEHSR